MSNQFAPQFEDAFARLMSLYKRTDARERAIVYALVSLIEKAFENDELITPQEVLDILKTHWADVSEEVTQ